MTIYIRSQFGSSDYGKLVYAFLSPTSWHGVTTSLRVALEEHISLQLLPTQREEQMQCGFDDPHLLIAGLHRQALLTVSRACGTKQQGLSVAARRVGMSSRWKRKLRELNSALGLVEKVSPQSCQLAQRPGAGNCQGVGCYSTPTPYAAFSRRLPAVWKLYLFRV